MVRTCLEAVIITLKVTPNECQDVITQLLSVITSPLVATKVTLNSPLLIWLFNCEICIYKSTPTTMQKKGQAYYVIFDLQL